ncbi:hypothetical protein [Reinekea blandensis]|uniref:Uncharacterized protein n=1 Tax=Reinekea blandensis MED297 TaxID=314283 RepID=A4BFM0_9GAMM|nr:hypothetical protein [Reinekea blandensis]EAR09115.1 hypothetical protein MED297_17273 [Reinekea sp. MED297] [Reinekea blandensis MED297]
MYPALKFFLLFVLIMPISANADLFGIGESGTNEELQHDLDIARINDLVLMSGYIQAFKEKTGSYPLQGEVPFPNYVYVATKEQKQYTEGGGPPYSHKNTPVNELIEELMTVLGSDIEIPFDLQRVPVNKPNFYIYMVHGDSYYFAVHLHHPQQYANKVSDHYYKVEVTNNEKAVRQGVWLRKDLLNDEVFLNDLSKTPIKPGYTESLRVKLGGNTAF